MLCRVDPLVVVLKSRCMRKDHSRRVPQEEAARRQEQLSSRHLLQAGGQGCVAFKFHPITGSTGRATRRRGRRKQLSSRHLLQAGGQSCVTLKFPPITGSTEEETRCRQRGNQVSSRHLLQAGGQGCVFTRRLVVIEESEITDLHAGKASRWDRISTVGADTPT